MPIYHMTKGIILRIIIFLTVQHKQPSTPYIKNYHLMEEHYFKYLHDLSQFAHKSCTLIFIFWQSLSICMEELAQPPNKKISLDLLTHQALCSFRSIDLKT